MMESMGLGVKYLENRTRKLFDYIEKHSLDIGAKYDTYIHETSDRRKYWCEVLLRVPLIFIIHQWLLLSPFSNYWIVDVILFFVRYGVALLLTGTWAFNCGVILNVYISLALDLTIAWVRYIDYWTYQDNAYEICHEKNVPVWSDVSESVRLPLTCSLLVQLTYLCIRPAALSHRWKEDGQPLVYIGLMSTLVPKFLSALSIFPIIMSELSYWIDSILLIIITLSEVITLMEKDAKIDEKKLFFLVAKFAQTSENKMKLKYKSAIEDLQRRIENRNKGQNIISRFPGKWFVRDLILFFGMIYLFMMILIEIAIYQRPMLMMITRKTSLEIFAGWCTTHIIVLVISYMLGLLSNISVAIGNWFLTKEIHIANAFDANIGGLVQVAALITFTEANVLALENEEKVDAMELVAFLTMYAVIFQTLDVLEQKIFQEVNNGSSPGILFYMRALILIGLLVTVPSLSTLVVSRSLNTSPWLLFFASGNCTLILRTVSMMVECVLIKVTWYTSNHLAEIEDILHYTRVCKTLILVVLNCSQSYCRYICPFFKGWWLMRLFLAIFSLIAVAGILGLDEFNKYKTRQRMFGFLRNLKDVEFVSGTADVEDSHECAICYMVMTKAKKLPCNHVFHNNCLRKWFQVRNVCPLCNTEIRDELTQVHGN